MGANSSKGSGGGQGAAVGAVANRQITRKAGPQKEDLFTCVTYSILAGASSACLFLLRGGGPWCSSMQAKLSVSCPELRDCVAAQRAPSLIQHFLTGQRRNGS